MATKKGAKSDRKVDTLSRRLAVYFQSLEDRDLVNEAARLTGVSASSYLVSIGLTAARKVISESRKLEQTAR